MKKRLLQIAMVLCCTLLLAASAAAHCEIPCGIYDDEARIGMLLEHVATIEKSMNQITTIEKNKDHNANQLVRWVMNKENHATELQEIVTQYFLTQRIKFDTKAYDKKLALLHQMLVYAMKCKQSTDLAHTAKLTGLIQEFKQLYFAE
ncbi:MAG: superoxide dismutase, Ni [Desulfobulbaceae bacterium]|jgi:nickel superoxide dismutase|nr:superoxide dismutase, Ni [Desulfobulbaceae bacterium]MDH3783290.1 superoxide dismutase, Ni [Desulfobulbaceae bacterium]MDH3866296.1 superoxide dismutase, Ni [Desulfobulbaceae bacterium]MDH3921271.1 superoxide dismutase, Ni [Desulfobulbaceae bacterium]HKJ14220.1 superoxide dismutase [Ni] [Desulfobulbales bacterium]